MKNPILSGLSGISQALKKTPLGRSEAIGKVHAQLTLWLHGKNQAQVGDFLVHFDPRDRYIAKKLVLYGSYEREEISLLTSFIEEGDYVLDVGANIGLYTLHLSRAVGPHGKVLAFEPDPDNYKFLQQNLEVNDCNNVVAFPFALGKENTMMRLYQTDGNRGNLSFADLAHTGQSIEVPVRSGREVLESFEKKARVAKIDVEGAEPMVLEGLGHSPEVLLIEYVPMQLKALGFNPVDVLKTLEQKKYQLFLIDEHHTCSTDPQSSYTIYETTSKSGRDHNVLAIHENASKKVEALI